MNRHNLPFTSLLALSLLSPLAALHAATPFGTPDQPVVSLENLDDLVITPVEIESLPKQAIKVGHVGEPGQPGREALLAAFTAFQAQYAADVSGKLTVATPWKDNGLVQISATLHQEPQNGIYLLGASAAHCVFVRTSATSAWQVGDKIQILAYKKGSQKWAESGDTDNVQKTPVYEQVKFPLVSTQFDPPTREQFIAALRAGQSFTILIEQKGPADEQPHLVVQKLSW
jgi:hypothetical protein